MATRRKRREVKGEGLQLSVLILLVLLFPFHPNSPLSFINGFCSRGRFHIRYPVPLTTPSSSTDSLLQISTVSPSPWTVPRRLLLFLRQVPPSYPHQASAHTSLLPNPFQPLKLWLCGILTQSQSPQHSPRRAMPSLPPSLPLATEESHRPSLLATVHSQPPCRPLPPNPCSLSRYSSNHNHSRNRSHRNLQHRHQTPYLSPTLVAFHSPPLGLPLHRLPYQDELQPRSLVIHPRDRDGSPEQASYLSRSTMTRYLLRPRLLQSLRSLLFPNVGRG